VVRYSIADSEDRTVNYCSAMGTRARHVAATLTSFFEGGDGDTPQERGTRHGKLCTDLSWLLAELMEGEHDWDARYTWLDGVAAARITETSPGEVEIVGGAFISHGAGSFNLRPVWARLSYRRDAPGSALPRRRTRPTWPTVEWIVCRFRPTLFFGLTYSSWSWSKPTGGAASLAWA
jgi:hypothetical protein